VCFVEVYAFSGIVLSKKRPSHLVVFSSPHLSNIVSSRNDQVDLVVSYPLTLSDQLQRKTRPSRLGQFLHKTFWRVYCQVSWSSLFYVTKILRW